jgi:hypothetical protein
MSYNTGGGGGARLGEGKNKRFLNGLKPKRQDFRQEHQQTVKYTDNFENKNQFDKN